MKFPIRRPGTSTRKRILLAAACLAMAILLSLHLHYVDAFLNVIKLLLITLAIGFLIDLIQEEYRRDLIILDPFSVPKSFEEAGISGEILAHRIRDRMLEIEEELRSVYRKSDLGIARDEQAIPELELPGAKVGLKAFVALLRKTTNRNLRHVSGDVTLLARFAAQEPSHPQEMTICLYITTGNQRSTPICLTLRSSELPPIINEIAVSILKSVDPILLAHIYHGRRDRPATEQVIQLVLKDKNSKKRQLAEAHTLQARIYRRADLHADTIEACTRAIQADPTFPDSYGMRALALGLQQQLREALKMYEQASKDFPNSALIYNCWGFTLFEEGKNQDEKKNRLRAEELWLDSIAKFELALEFEKNYIQALTNWGSALARLKRKEEAILKFQTALELDPDNPDIHTAHANGLDYLSRFEAEATQPTHPSHP